MSICLGLAANKLHHQTEDAALFALLRAQLGAQADEEPDLSSDADEPND